MKGRFYPGAPWFQPSHLQEIPQPPPGLPPASPQHGRQLWQQLFYITTIASGQSSHQGGIGQHRGGMWPQVGVTGMDSHQRCESGSYLLNSHICVENMHLSKLKSVFVCFQGWARRSGKMRFDRDDKKGSQEVVYINGYIFLWKHNGNMSCRGRCR